MFIGCGRMSTDDQSLDFQIEESVSLTSVSIYYA